MSTPIDSRLFRDALGCFPTGVAVITTLDAGQPTGLTCNSFSSVSLDPPLVLWSLRTNSRSLEAFRRGGAFAINILGEDQNLLSAHFASSTVVNKFEGVSWHQGSTGMPVLDGCVASFECTTFAEHEAGDHVVFIGRVEQFEHVRRDDPLVFYRGTYMMLARSLREMTLSGEIVRADLDVARALLFRALLPMACANGQTQDFDAMETLLHEMEGLLQPAQMARRSELAVQFLQHIATASHNRVLSIVAQSLYSLLHHAATVNQARDVAQGLIPLRWQMLDALRARDPKRALAALDAYVEEMHALQA